VKPSPIQLRVCPECDASNDSAAPSCWLCHRPLGKDTNIVDAELVPESRLGIGETLFAVLTVCTVGLTLLLIVGAAKTDPGLAILVAICAGPAFLATIIRTLGRKVRGKPFSWQSTFVTFAVSAAAMVGIAAVLIVAAVVALIVICFRMLAAQ
jgi:hypothetical protein